MDLELNSLYVELLKYPNASKPYRDLAGYCRKKGMLEEYEAFLQLLSIRFGEIPNLDDYHTNTY